MDALRHRVGQLAESARGLLRMKYTDGLTAAEIGRRLRRSEQAVFQSLYRIHCALRGRVGLRLSDLPTDREAVRCPPDPARLHLLFGRYAENTLTAAEADELEQAFREPAVLRQFEGFFLEAAVAVNCDRMAPVGGPADPHPPQRRWTRRQLFGTGLAGLATGAGAMALFRPWGRVPLPPAPAAPPSDFAWDYPQPLPTGWVAGTRIDTPDGVVYRPTHPGDRPSRYPRLADAA